MALLYLSPSTFPHLKQALEDCVKGGRESEKGKAEGGLGVVAGVTFIMSLPAFPLSDTLTLLSIMAPASTEDVGNGVQVGLGELSV